MIIRGGGEMKKAGRKKQFDTPGWKPVSIQLPGEVFAALHEYAHVKGKKKAAITRELLERLLEKEGFLKVIESKDDEGRPVRSYVAIRVSQ